MKSPWIYSKLLKSVASIDWLIDWTNLLQWLIVFCMHWFIDWFQVSSHAYCTETNKSFCSSQLWSLKHTSERIKSQSLAENSREKNQPSCKLSQWQYEWWLTRNQSMNQPMQNTIHYCSKFYQINQSMPAVLIMIMIKSKEFFKDIFEVGKVKGGGCYSTYQLGVFSLFLLVG